MAEVFLVAWRKIDMVPPGDAARAWLYATARRVTANTRRSLHRRDALADRISQERLIDGLQSEAQSAEENVVHEALAMLSDGDREVLLLVQWEGLRPTELAEVLECQEGPECRNARGLTTRDRRSLGPALNRSSPSDRPSPKPSVKPLRDDPVGLPPRMGIHGRVDHQLLGELTSSERGRTSENRRDTRQPGPGDRRIVQFTELVLEPRSGPGESFGFIAERRGNRLRGISHSLGQYPDSMQVVEFRTRRQGVYGPLELAPALA